MLGFTSFFPLVCLGGGSVTTLLLMTWCDQVTGAGVSVTVQSVRLIAGGRSDRLPDLAQEEWSRT